MTTRTDPNIWPGLTYEDPLAARKWLAELGFEAGILVEGDGPGEVVHSEMLWPDGGRVMLYSARSDDPSFPWAPGVGSVYVVARDPDAVFARAEALGARLVRPMTEEDYGSRGFTIADPEGNVWSFGTYDG
ncbi:VOC family protein [Tsukamurella soli]|uniref:VOC family protein n=1 Tax=Tsukamurella soli TaxID=644556 RepID=A0ABP8JEI9_9ACTN